MLKPEASADGLAMHLAIPANIAANHMLTFDPARYLWAVMPMGADFTYAIVYLLGGEMAARLLNFAILLVLLGLLHAAVRRWVSPGVAWLLVTLFATTPMVQLVTGSLFVENLLAAFLLGMMTALWRFGESGERRSLYLAAAFGGTAMAIKFGAIVILAPALACAAVEVWRRRKQTGVRWALAAGLLLLAAAPPYAIAWIKTGNPVFPFANDRFHSRQLDPKAGSRTGASPIPSHGKRRTTSPSAPLATTKVSTARLVFSIWRWRRSPCWRYWWRRAARQSPQPWSRAAQFC